MKRVDITWMDYLR